MTSLLGKTMSPVLLGKAMSVLRETLDFLLLLGVKNCDSPSIKPFGLFANPVDSNPASVLAGSGGDCCGGFGVCSSSLSEEEL